MKQRLKGLLSIWLAIAMLFCGIVPVGAIVNPGITFYYYNSDTLSYDSFTVKPDETLKEAWAEKDNPIGQILKGFNVKVYNGTINRASDLTEITIEDVDEETPSYIPGDEVGKKTGSELYTTYSLYKKTAFPGSSCPKRLFFFICASAKGNFLYGKWTVQTEGA